MNNTTSSPHKSRRALLRSLGLVEAGIQECQAKQNKIQEAADDYHGRIQSRLTQLDGQGGGEPELRARLLTARHWCGVAGA